MFGRLANIVAFVIREWRFLQKWSDRPWYPLFRDVVLVFAVAFMGVASALVIIEPWGAPAPAVESVAIGGLEVATGGGRSDELVRMVRDRLRSSVTLKAGDFSHTTTWAALGAQVDMGLIDRVLDALGKKGGDSARYFWDEAGEEGLPEIPLPISLRIETALEAMVSLKELVDRKPRSARFDFDSGDVIGEESGRTLDVYESLARLDDALGSNRPELDIAVEQVPAKVTRNDLEKIDVSQVVGFFETRISRMIKDRDRTHNVKLGASILNGEVIMPGQTFSFNEELGDRTEAKGFRYAPVIAGGVLVEGMGGGTCQLASTLYAASFFSGLVTVDRRPHSRPSGYIKIGLDATVSYPDLDLKIANPLDFPIVIHFKVEEGVVRAELRGRERPFTVTLLRKIVGTRPFPVRTIEDPLLPRGKEVVTQIGVPGYKVHRYQVIERDKVGYRFQIVDEYPPTTQFVHKGTGDKNQLNGSKDAPKPDTHPPYHASNYLRMVQGPDGLWYESSHK